MAGLTEVTRFPTSSASFPFLPLLPFSLGLCCSIRGSPPQVVGLYPRCSRRPRPDGLPPSEPRSGRSIVSRGSERSVDPGQHQALPVRPSPGGREISRLTHGASFHTLAIASPSGVVGDHVTSVIPAMAGVATPWWGHRATTLGLFVDEPQGEGPDAAAGRRARGIAPTSPLRPCGIGRRSRFSQA